MVRTSDDFRETLMSVKSVILQDADVLHGTLHHGFRSGMPILGQNLLFEGTAVHPDADGDLPLLGHVDDLSHPVRPADVSGVQPKTVNTCRESPKSQSVVKMNVRDERDVDGFLDSGKLADGLFVEDRNPHHFTAGLLEAFDLGDRGLPVPRVRVGHGLDHNGGPTPYRNPAHTNLLGNPSFFHWKKPFYFYLIPA